MCLENPPVAVELSSRFANSSHDSAGFVCECFFEHTEYCNIYCTFVCTYRIGLELSSRYRMKYFTQ